MFPKISVIMSVYNGQEYLTQSIESILNQSFREFEFIIIDDTSTDNTPKILKKYSEKEKRIKIFTNSSNLGLTKSLNIGIINSKGKYIARQDAGDISLPERLAKQYDYLEKNKDIFLCGTNLNFIHEKKVITQTYNNLLFDIHDIKKTLPKKNCFVHTSVMFRNNNTYYREKFYFAQDYDLYLNLLSANKKMINLPDKLVLWRMDPRAISFSNRKKQTLFGIKAREFYKQRNLQRKDEYNNFNPATILSRQTNEQSNELLCENKIIIYLQNKKYREAKEIYRHQYCELKNVNRKNKIILLTFINFPFLYKIYKKISFQKTK